MDHAAYAELIAGRALGDLDAAESDVVDRHLADCPHCASMTHDLDAVLGDLALAAPARPVPPALGPSILAAIRREGALTTAAAAGVAAGAVAASGPWLPGARDTAPPWTETPAAVTPAAATVHAPTPASPPTQGARAARLARRRWSRWLVGGAAVGLAAASAIAILSLDAQVTDLRDQLAEAQLVARAAADQVAARDVAMQVVADPSHASAWLDPSEGATVGSALVLYRPGSTDAYLVANDLPASPIDRVYQFWYADASGVHPGVTFDHDGEGVLLIPVQVDLRGAQAAMLTLEPIGGATGAPGQDIVFGELPAS